MSASYIIISFWPYTCQKLSKSVEIWQSYDKNSFDYFLKHGVEEDAWGLPNSRAPVHTRAPYINLG